MRGRERAITLIELVVAVALIGVLLALAAPAFAPALEDNRLATSLNRLRTSLQLARNHAVTSRIKTVVCKTSGSACVTVGDWSNGWMVFEDPADTNGCTDGDGDGYCDTGGGRILMIGRRLPQGLRLDATGNLSYRVPYDAMGATPGYMGTFSLCSEAMPAKSRGLTVLATGRVRLADRSRVDCD